MIRSFTDKETETIWLGIQSRRLPPSIQDKALVKLALLNRAASLADLRVPPANRLEKLQGDRKGQYSIRINEQWRICFVWKEGAAHGVEITDYHA